MGADSQQCSCGLALEDRAGQAYNEGAFRHFLAIERARAEHSNRSFLLLLVTLKKDPRAGSVRIAPPVAARLFAGLAHCVREVDFIGWYRQERVAAAVLTQGADTPALDVPERVAGRVRTLLTDRLSSSVAQRLQVRVLQLRRRPEC